MVDLVFDILNSRIGRGALKGMASAIHRAHHAVMQRDEDASVCRDRLTYFHCSSKYCMNCSSHSKCQFLVAHDRTILTPTMPSRLPHVCAMLYASHCLSLALRWCLEVVA